MDLWTYPALLLTLLVAAPAAHPTSTANTASTASAAQPVGSAGAATGESDDPRLRLAPILGTWDVYDLYQPPGAAPIREIGVRTCAWALRERYVECVTQARNAQGREREYRWLINYNPETGRYDLVGVFSNYLGKVNQTLRIDDTGKNWTIRAPSSIDDGIERWSWALLVFEGDDRATWTTYRNLETAAPTDWHVTTRETWRRRKDG